MHTVRLAHHAMATRFECILLGEDKPGLRAAGEQALHEIAVLEERLSFYRASSELSTINRLAAVRPVRPAPDLFELLLKAKEIWRTTAGAFDPSVGALMKTWGFIGGTGSKPESDRLTAARRLSGMGQVVLDPKSQTVAYDQPGVAIDLGSIAKGYAIDVAVQTLRDCGVSRALVHGGTSTVCALGTDYTGTPWTVGIPGESSRMMGQIAVTDCALSVSAVSGKYFVDDTKRYGHIIDPRTGIPSSEAKMAAVVADSAAASDALSTAALVLARQAPLIENDCTAWGVLLAEEYSDRWIGSGVLSFPNNPT